MAIKFVGYCPEDQVAIKPARRADLDMLARMKRGKSYKVVVTELRSKKADGLYHDALTWAARNWPEGMWPNPDGDKELLRAGLQCKAGPRWRKSVDFEPGSVKSALFLIEEFRGEEKYAFTQPVELTDPKTGELGQWLRVHVPISIAHEAMPEKAMVDLRRAVIEQIEEVFEMEIKAFIHKCKEAAHDKEKPQEELEDA
jgi:hypothetical protein